jgi:hypothetical protein
MKYAVEMGSGVTIYKPSFIKIGSGIRKLIRGYTDSMEIAYSYFGFFKMKFAHGVPCPMLVSTERYPNPWRQNKGSCVQNLSCSASGSHPFRFLALLRRYGALSLTHSRFYFKAT